MRAGAVAALVLLALAPAAWAAPGGPSEALALKQGNRLFVHDQIEAALEAYAAGWSGKGSEPESLRGALAYNAGTSALRLGRLPEALLWYRRAEAATPHDPWIRDNLALTRQSLGSLAAEGDGAWEAWMANGRRLQAAAVVLAWAGLGLLGLGRRRSRGLVILLALSSCLAFATGEVLDHHGPRAAVLLAACPGGPPAGSEVWVHPTRDGWRILGPITGREGARCPARAVGLVAP